MKRSNIAVLTVASLLSINGCTTTEDTVQTTNTTNNTSGIVDNTTVQKYIAYYVDEPISNADYICGESKGKTQENGGFYFQKNKSCEFYIGNLLVRTIPANKLEENATFFENNITKASFLQSLDTNSDDNIITIEDSIKDAIDELNIKTIPQTEDERKTLIEQIKTLVQDTKPHFVSDEDAKKHLAQTEDRYKAREEILHYLDTLQDKTDDDIQNTNQTNKPEEITGVKPTTPQNPQNNDTQTKDNGNNDKPHVITNPTEPKTPTENTNDDIKNNTPTNVDDETKTSNDNTDDDTNTPTTETEDKTFTKVSENLYINPNKDVAVLIVPDLNKSEKLIYKTETIQNITKKLYANFEDDFDFIFLVTNNKKRPSSVSYAGVFSKVKNDVEGIGAPIYSNSARYGSQGKLKGIMHLAYRRAIVQGPTLHEISHYWANKFRFDFKKEPGYRLGSTSHWGETSFFGGKGQLGGSDANTFKSENYTYTSQKTGKVWNLYSADYYGWNANGANRIPYNDAELYLMGMIPKSEVKDLILPKPYGMSLPPEVKEDEEFRSIYDNGRRYFLAQEVIRRSWSQMLSEHNIPDRKPNYQESQKEFKVLTVLLDTQLPKEFEVDTVSAQIESLAFEGDDNNPNNYNFWEATRHKGKLLVGNLTDKLKSSTNTEDVVLYETFQPEEITYRGLTYKTVKSPYTDRIWLDRNLGAKKVCESFDDKECYGDLFEYGRGFDGHQNRYSEVTDQRKTQITDNDDKFVLIANSTPYDWVEDGIDDDISERTAFFSSDSGDGICPQGFRVPTIDELGDETKYNEKSEPFPTASIEDNFLRLPLAGYRNSQALRKSNSLYGEAQEGSYWSTTHYQYSENVPSVKYVHFNKDGGFLTYGTRYIANGSSIRCIKSEK